VVKRRINRPRPNFTTAKQNRNTANRESHARDDGEINLLPKYTRTCQSTQSIQQHYDNIHYTTRLEAIRQPVGDVVFVLSNLLARYPAKREKMNKINPLMLTLAIRVQL